jgi:WD40 repeat protein
MTERELDARVRTWFRAIDDEPMPRSLHGTVSAIPDSVAVPRWNQPDLLRWRSALVLVAATALLVTLLAAATALGWLRLPLPSAPTDWQMIVERDTAHRTNNSFFLGLEAGSQPVPILTGAEDRGAMKISWSPDGQRVGYVIGGPVDPAGAFLDDDVHVADADGTYALPVEDPPQDSLLAGERKVFEFGDGPVWSPDSSMFAVSWSTGSCSGGPACIPTSGIDVFEPDGRAVISFLTPGAFVAWPYWAPDSSRIGWLSAPGSLNGSVRHEFRSQSTARLADVRVLGLGNDVYLQGWTRDDRLLLVAMTDEEPITAYSMRSDGADRRDVLGTFPAGSSVRWSPDGRWIAFNAGREARITIRETSSAVDVRVPLPHEMAMFQPMAWSPDGTRLLLAAPGGGFDLEGPVEVYMVSVDDRSVRHIGPAHAVSWRPVAE